MVPPITVTTSPALANVITARWRIATPVPASGIGLPSTAIWSPASLGDSDASDLEEFSTLDEPAGLPGSIRVDVFIWSSWQTTTIGRLRQEGAQAEGLRGRRRDREACAARGEGDEQVALPIGEIGSR
jgi:hypothetical protein